jgi:peptide/nickel transport system substrate-binding protein
MINVRRKFLALALGGVVGASCTSVHAPSRQVEAIHRTGGTLLLAASYDFSAALDPQLEYEARAWELFRCCLLRTLLSYNGAEADRGGTVPRPDLAASAPTVSSDGLTWSFRLRPGLRYAPPLQDVPIVSGDIIRALEREAMVGGERSYAFYYRIIQGFADFEAGRADSISGLQAPNDQALVIRLVHPDGDLAYLMAMPATAPIPPRPGHPTDRLGIATGHRRDFGRFLVSSGPYMIAGSGALDLSVSPDQQSPASGFDPQAGLELVRNPSWSRADDPLRSAYVDSIHLSTGIAGKTIERQVADGTTDLSFTEGGVSLPAAKRSEASGSAQLAVEAGGDVNYIPFNLAVKPFDDVWVRRAVSFVVDRSKEVKILARAYFGSGTQAPFTHLIPDAVENGLLTGYDPFRTADRADAVRRARAAMARSRYDENGDGSCDASVCSAVPALAIDDASRRSIHQLGNDLRLIGISLKVVTLPLRAFVGAVTAPQSGYGLTTAVEWAADYTSASTFFVPLLRAPATRGTNRDLSLIGSSAAELAGWGYVVRRVPSARERVDRCVALIGDAQVECWALLDKYLMERVVPWIPISTSTVAQMMSARVGGFAFDGSLPGMASIDHIWLQTSTDPSSP